MSGADLITKRYLNDPAPGISRANREHTALVEACEAVDRDIQNQGAISYESVRMVRDVLAMVRRVA